ncbi:DUF5343 domain-containing protein [Candidatus Poriferisocius sp.]|uniref:DUF5343 domain-containing protein n=1 Tax=Candidatus Poriferisocius sp. TaxID=3101276 RepID=UPI003B5B05C4
MADEKLPYVTSTGSLTKALTKIQSAATPDRFTQDFLATKLGLSGGGAKPVIPFLKRTGFLASDGTPTETYKHFRNQKQRGAAAAAALRTGYAPLFEANEYAYELNDDDLRGLIVQITGAEEGSRMLTAIVGSFKALLELAQFDESDDHEADGPGSATSGDDGDDPTSLPDQGQDGKESLLGDLSIGYTINLHLPATSDIAVFNAIFKSLRENLLR